ncbi:MAG TPA: STAS domain-containing protein [Actinomycetota bacterium]|nr:STAS domain-containing protein [Actinomycetota bacterium]
MSDRQPPERLLEIEPGPNGLRILGDVDLSTAEVFAQAVRARALEGGDVILDLSGCTLLSSEAIGTLIDTATGLARDGRLVLRAPAETVRRVLELSGLAERPNVDVEPA